MAPAVFEPVRFVPQRHRALDGDELVGSWRDVEYLRIEAAILLRENVARRHESKKADRRRDDQRGPSGANPDRSHWMRYRN